jgi:hypothetical protein
MVFVADNPSARRLSRGFILNEKWFEEKKMTRIFHPHFAGVSFCLDPQNDFGY